MLQILIENAEDIGALPPHIVQNISTETSGSTDNGLDSFELHRKHKKKKHRSGSLTRKPLKYSRFCLNKSENIFTYSYLDVQNIFVYKQQ